MDIISIVQWTSYAIAGILLLTIPLRMHLLTKKTGQCLLPLTQRKSLLYIVIMALAVIMLIVLMFREFSMLIVIALHGTAVLGIEISIREMLYRTKAGVYEKMLIVDGHLVKRQHMVLFPTLEYEQTADRTLEIVTQKKGSIIVHFENETERANAVDILRKWIDYEADADN